MGTCNGIFLFAVKYFTYLHLFKHDKILKQLDHSLAASGSYRACMTHILYINTHNVSFYESSMKYRDVSVEKNIELLHQKINFQEVNCQIRCPAN